MPLSEAAAKQKPRQSREDDCCGTARDANPFSPSLPYFRVLVLTGVWSCTGHRRDAWDTKKRMVMRSTGVCSHEAKHDVWSFPHHHPSCQGRDGIWHTRSTNHGDFSFESQITTSRVSPLTSQRIIFSAGSALFDRFTDNLSYGNSILHAPRFAPTMPLSQVKAYPALQEQSRHNSEPQSLQASPSLFIQSSR